MRGIRAGEHEFRESNNRTGKDVIKDKMRRFSKVKFAAFVKKTRESKGLSMRQTANKAGLTLARVVAIEHGEARLNLPQLVSLADAFGFKSGGHMLTRYEKVADRDKKMAEPKKEEMAIA
jgi:transcriptional regulator with XRE-family HTH domain